MRHNKGLKWVNCSYNFLPFEIGLFANADMYFSFACLPLYCCPVMSTRFSTYLGKISMQPIITLRMSKSTITLWESLKSSVSSQVDLLIAHLGVIFALGLVLQSACHELHRILHSPRNYENGWCCMLVTFLYHAFNIYVICFYMFRLLSSIHLH